MFNNAIQELISTLTHRKSRVPKDGHIDIYGRAVDGGDEFFHPKKFTGIPVLDVKSILKDYQPQLNKLKQHVEIGDHRTTPDGRSLYDTIYTSVIERYVEFCHMIPASEDHHHSHTGGLLLHSLEASVDSLRWAKEKHYGLSGFVDIDAQVKPVMNYCAWLAALLHDAGKMMTDISVDAVEMYDKRTKKQSPASDSILSWHPAKESLIDWAKRHNVASYSVNFLSNRTHNRHNVDSSQILQPILRNHYAMEYLFSTPVKQEVYSALTNVLSGYSTSDDFLSEAVRMGDSASTTRSLGYLYDSKLGSRTMSTAQRLYRCIRHAAKDWRWNELDAQGWILGGDVFIRWTSTVEDIITVSVALGYSLPVDVKNVLNIMDSNHITDLFDKSAFNDRIVRFTPGEFTHEEIIDIQIGKKQKRWNDLLKLRGPEVVFAETPMPFSKCGIFYLPKADVFYVMTKTGELTKLPAVAGKQSDTKKVTLKEIKEDAAIEPVKNLVKTSNNSYSSKRSSKALQSIIASNPKFIMDGDHAIISTADIPLKEGETLKDILRMLDKYGELEINLNIPALKTIICEVEGKKQKCLKLTKRASTHFRENQHLTENQSHKTKVRNIKASFKESSVWEAPQDDLTPVTINLRDIVGVSTTFTFKNKIYLNIDSAVACSDFSETAILHFLSKENYMEILDDKSPIECLTSHMHKGQAVRAALLSKECIRRRFSEADAVKFDNPEVLITRKKSRSFESESNTQQLDYLVKTSNVGSLLQYLLTQDSLDSITENGMNGFYLKTSEIKNDTSKKLNLTRLRAYMSAKKFPFSESGYLLSAHELSKIQLCDVTFDY